MADLELTVIRADVLCTGVRSIEFAAPDGRRLPSFTPGSNIAISYADGQRNSYSLTGPALSPESYSISVLLNEDGRGGSRWAHQLPVGSTVVVSRPRSAFPPILTAKHHVFIAGGIGVTPILSHVRAAVEWGRSFEVLYSFREGTGAHLDELRELCGDRLTTFTSQVDLWRHLSPALLDQPIGSHLYVCGPVPMIEAVTSAAADAGWNDARVHSEAFGVGALDPGSPFAATLALSGKRVDVASGTSLLEALLQSGTSVANLCRQGVCGECRVPVRSGAIEHRDIYLTADEKAAGDCMMACVSRAADTELELEL